MVDKLNDTEIQERLRLLPEWTREGDKIKRTVTCRNFVSALDLVNEVGAWAERHDHHPDILLHNWNKVTITLTTHSAGGLTNKDFELALDLEKAIAKRASAGSSNG